VGSGFRTFTAGEVLTASNVQNYLMDQSVMVFGGSAARSSAIGTANFEEGMVSYLTDTDKLEVYNGTNWVSVAPTTSTPMGVLINSTSFSGVASQSITSVFSSTYDNYKIIWNNEPVTSSGQNILVRLRTASDDSSANYSHSGFYNLSNSTALVADGDNASTSWRTVFMATTAGDYASANMDLFAPNLAKPSTFQMIGAQKAGSISTQVYRVGALNTTTQYTGFTFFVSTTMTGTVSVYGYNK
jgi:hypothetical protein